MRKPFIAILRFVTAFAVYGLAGVSMAGNAGFGESDVSAEVEGIFLAVESLGPDNVIVVGVDFDMTTAEENFPMVLAVLRHAFARDIPVLLTAFNPDGERFIEQAFDSVTDSCKDCFCEEVSLSEYRDVIGPGIESKDELVEAWEDAGNVLPENAIGWVFEGWDYVLLGHAPMFNVVILGMNDSIEAQFPSDMNGNSVSGMPVVQEHSSLREVDLAVTVSSSSNSLYWVTCAADAVALPVVICTTGAMAEDYRQYLESGRIAGLMPGSQGASEYESLLAESGLFR